MQPLLLEGVAKQLMRVRKWEQGGNPEQDKARAEAGGHACLSRPERPTDACKHRRWGLPLPALSPRKGEKDS